MKQLYIEKIFVLRLKFIYIPLQNNLAMTDTNRLRAFVENLLSKPTYQPNADTVKLLEILNYISVEPRFNINSLELFIQKLENPEEEEKIQSDKPKNAIRKWSEQEIGMRERVRESVSCKNYYIEKIP